MPRHAEKRVLPYSVEQVFDMVADVERYPEFLPWCLGCRVVSRAPGEIRADLLIGFRVFRERWHSRVLLDRPRQIVDALHPAGELDAGKGIERERHALALAQLARVLLQDEALRLHLLRIDEIEERRADPDRASGLDRDASEEETRIVVDDDAGGGREEVERGERALDLSDPVICLLSLEQENRLVERVDAALRRRSLGLDRPVAFFPGTNHVRREAGASGHDPDGVPLWHGRSIVKLTTACQRK